MKLLMSVFMIKFIMALFENKAKGNKPNKEDGDEHIKHPAAFNVR